MGTNSFILLAIIVFGIGAFIQKEWRQRKRISRLKDKFPLIKLGDLREGDSFIFQLNDDAEIYRVVGSKEYSCTVTVNKLMRSDMKSINEDEEAWADTMVYFIRHTIPVVGQDCFIEDLAPGDKFQLFVPDATSESGGNLILCEIMEKGFDFDRFRRIDTGDVGRIGRLTKVVFIGHRTDKLKAVNSNQD